jgi:hypothetical protein
MKLSRLSLALLSLGGIAIAQDSAQPAVVSAVPATPLRSPQELEQLVGPIALYPDALIALILPASTVPTDIVLAARHLRENPGDRSQIEHRAWDESVKSLTNYPEVVMWMDENLHWTRQLGEAFVVQPADVMQAVQRLRAQARANGTLVDTPQQQIIAEPQVIRIVPAQPDVIYVPHYEPDIVFVDRPVYYSRPFISFGIGVPVGSWLAFDCDWRRHSIWVGNRHRRWTGHDWHRPVVPIAPTYARHPEVRQWRPPPTVRPTVTITQRVRPEIARPVPFGVATTRSYSYRDHNSTPRVDRADYANPATSPNRTYTPGYRGDQSRGTGLSSVDNTPAVAPQLTAPPIPSGNRAHTPGYRTETTRNHGVSSIDNTPAVNPRLSAPPAQPQTAAPAQPQNVRRFDRNDDSRGRDDGNRSRDDGSRSRNFRNPQPAATVTMPQAAPQMPATTPQVRTMPAPAADNPPHRSFNRGAPPANTAPSLPAARSTPPAIATPPPPPASTAPANPPSNATPQNNGGESRGHRGSYRRDNS